GVSAITALTGVKGAYLNVRINLPGVKDEEFKKNILEQAENILKQSIELAEKVEKNVLEKL
ncbi:glutamate formimidoyltransferase, partial [bacterium]